MGKRDQALEMLKNGMSPALIAKTQQVTLETILGYLDGWVGKGKLRRSDILFSVPPAIRKYVIQHLQEYKKVRYDRLKRQILEEGKIFDKLEILVAEKYGDARHAFGDLYDDIRHIEIRLHQTVQDSLKQHFGMEWWEIGVPLEIRKQCNEWKATDGAKDHHAYYFTSIIHILKIIESNWDLISSTLAPSTKADKKLFRKNLQSFNRLRNKIMHPLRGRPTDQDFEFLAKFKNYLGYLN